MKSFIIEVIFKKIRYSLYLLIFFNILEFTKSGLFAMLFFLPCLYWILSILIEWETKAQLQKNVNQPSKREKFIDYSDIPNRNDDDWFCAYGE